MAATPIDQLTESQRACLRLVYTHHSSKEIAALEGVSPSAVDKRIERAVQTLGAGSRFEAARQLHFHENGRVSAEPTSERLPSDPFDLSDPPPSPATSSPVEPWGLVRRFLGLQPGSGYGGIARVRLTRTERLVRMVGIMVMIAFVSVAMVNMAMTLTSIFRASRGAVSINANARLDGSRSEGPPMLMQRRRAADAVTAQFLKAEHSVDAAAQAAASCVATLLEQRAAANLPVATGLQALQLISDASADLIRARQRFVEAHAALVDVRRDIGLGAFYGYGDEQECPPNEGAARVAERAAGAPTLVAVA